MVDTIFQSIFICLLKIIRSKMAKHIVKLMLHNMVFISKPAVIILLILVFFQFLSMNGRYDHIKLNFFQYQTFL